MRFCYNFVIYLFIIFLLQACSGASVAPVAHRGEVKEPEATVTKRGGTTKSVVAKPAQAKKQNRSGFHVVEKGDTLYSIAWRYDFDFKSVARWNQINPPHTIFPGQIIRLKPPLSKKGESLKPAPAAKKITPKQRPKATPAKKPTVTAKKKTKPQPVLSKGPVKWTWPAAGKLVKSNSPTSKKGIDISGKAGQLIKAAGAGEVVYSGSGLLGYGKLIIIKHSETYLSAYAYNSKLLVKEGDRVNAGQGISEMGKDHTGRNILHFEIRKNGKPVSPRQYLPRKRV